MNKTRRKFIKEVALTGVVSTCIPKSGVLAYINEDQEKQNMTEGMVFLFQGDSITDGNRGRDNDPNHIMGHGYAFSIASRIGADFPEKKLTFYNRGISGNKVNDLADRWQTDTLDLKPDVLSILVGINDSSSAVFQYEPVITIEKYKELYKLLIDKTLASLPNIILVLCEPFILKVGRVKDNWDAYYSDVTKRQAIVKDLTLQYDAVFVGFQKVLDEACKKAPADYWIWDGVHPTVPGHELLAREWIKQIEKRISF